MESTYLNAKMKLQTWHAWHSELDTLHISTHLTPNMIFYTSLHPTRPYTHRPTKVTWSHEVSQLCASPSSSRVMEPLPSGSKRLKTSKTFEEKPAISNERKGLRSNKETRSQIFKERCFGHKVKETYDMGKSNTLHCKAKCDKKPAWCMAKLCL